MSRLMILAAFVACRGGITEPKHEVVPCIPDDDARCERACAESSSRPSEPGFCNAIDGRLCMEDTIEIYEGERGCCLPDDDVLRWHECQ